MPEKSSIKAKLFESIDFKKNLLFLIVAGLLGVALHLGTIAIDVLIIQEKIFLEPNKNFLETAFSFPFFPVLILEILLTFLIITIYKRMRGAMAKAYEQELKRQKSEETTQQMQKLMAVLAQHIASNNAEILSRLEFRKSKGQQVSDRIEQSSRNIAEILAILSEVSFVAPYIEENKENYDPAADFERRVNKLLNKKTDESSEE